MSIPSVSHLEDQRLNFIVSLDCPRIIRPNRFIGGRNY
jgi:hypothetical protein